MRILTVLSAAAVLGSGEPTQAQNTAEIQPEGLFDPETVFVQQSLQQGGFLAERGTIRSRTVRLDARRLAEARQPGAPLTLNLFEDATFETVVERVRPTRGAGYVMTARLPGTDWGEMMLAVNGGAVSGMVETSRGSYTIRSAGFGRLTIREIDRSAAALCATPPERAAENPPSLPGAENPLLLPATANLLQAALLPSPSVRPAPGSPGPGPASGTGPWRAHAAGGVDDGSQIDMLVVYTPAARNELGGAAEIENHIDLAFVYANTALEDSGAVPRFHLAHAEAVNYDAAGSGHGALDALRDPGDGRMDRIHALRNQYAADLVHLLVADVSDVCGVAYMDGEFSVASVNCPPFVTARELGHNLGLSHDRYQHAEDSQRANFSGHNFGYANQRAFAAGAPESSRWITIMAYDAQCTTEGSFSYARIRRFSNPDLTYGGDPTGVPVSHPSAGVDGPADARRYINDHWRRAAARRSTRCTNFSVSPGARTVGPNGGLTTFAVDTAAQCVWQAQSQADFIAVTSEAFQTGPGIVELSVSPNGGTERTGTVTVAGQTVTVRQLSTEPGGVCGRTAQVADAITLAAGFNDPRTAAT